MISELKIRKTIESDFEAFFELQRDYDSQWMIALIERDFNDQEHFRGHFEKIISDPTNHSYMIFHSEKFIGNICCFKRDGVDELGYMIAKEYWGKGIATWAVAEILKLVKIRPLNAGVCSDNAGSIRVLEKAGFREVGRVKVKSKIRGCEVVMVEFKLD